MADIQYDASLGMKYVYLLNLPLLKSPDFIQPLSRGAHPAGGNYAIGWHEPTFFRISDMNYCALGPGAWNFGQSGPTTHMDARQNVLAAIVRWLEQGIAPETLTGTKYTNDTVSLGEEFQRKHCRYPFHNVYRRGNPRDPEAWSCIE